MSEQGYWSTYATNRVARRRLLQAGAGSIGLGALFLVGCGSDDDDDDEASTGGNSPEQPSSTTSAGAAMVEGGTLRIPLFSEPAGFDPLASATGSTQQVVDAVYSRLVRFKAGPLPDALKLELDPDLATEWESTPDFTEWTFKLRPGITWHNKPPVNGRPLTAEDAVASLERINTQPGVYKSYLRDVDHIETPDDLTVVFKLNRANSVFANTLGNFGIFRIMPRETGIDFDPKTEMIGTAPWIFDSYEPSRKLSFSRNDAHWTVPHFDSMEMLQFGSVSDNLARLSTGEVDMVTRVVTPADFSQAQSLGVQQSQSYFQTTSRLLTFEGLSSRTEAYDPASPFLDDRVRRAMSMTIDRAALNQAFAVPADELVIDNMVAAGLQAWWLDPTGSEISPEAAAIYQLNIPEAKKLMAAASYGDGFETALYHNATTYGEAYVNRAQAVANQWQSELGIKASLNPQEYNVFLSTTFAGKSKGMGFILKTYYSGLEAVDTHLHSASTNNYGSVSDPEIDALIDKAYSQPIEEAIRLVKQVQELADRQAYYITMDPDTNFDFAAKNLGGFLDHFATLSTFGSEVAPFLFRTEG